MKALRIGVQYYVLSLYSILHNSKASSKLGGIMLPFPSWQNVNKQREVAEEGTDLTGMSLNSEFVWGDAFPILDARKGKVAAMAQQRPFKLALA